METVYRIQNREGDGPYRSLGSTDWMTSDHDLERGIDRNPAPFEDFGMETWKPMVDLHSDRLLFGFRTLKQLKKWFNKTERKRLVTYGYKVYQLQVNRIVGESSKQCAFLK